MIADGFGDNDAALALQEQIYYVSTKDGSVHDHPNNDDCLSLTATIGSFQLTQASRLAAQAIAETKLHGVVMDWGCGGGVLALLAAAQPNVQFVIGLDYEAQNIVTCRQNARQNGLENKATFVQSDSFHPFEEEDRNLLANLRGKVDFVLANPPASKNDDGFSFRRRILREAAHFLKPHGQVLFQALSYYGPYRVIDGAKQASDFWNAQHGNQRMEYQYKGITKSSI